MVDISISWYKPIKVGHSGNNLALFRDEEAGPHYNRYPCTANPTSWINPLGLQNKNKAAARPHLVGRNVGTKTLRSRSGSRSNPTIL
jgi:hypothetical protein